MPSSCCSATCEAVKDWFSFCHNTLCSCTMCEDPMQWVLLKRIVSVWIWTCLGEVGGGQGSPCSSSSFFADFGKSHVQNISIQVASNNGVVCLICLHRAYEISLSWCGVVIDCGRNYKWPIWVTNACGLKGARDPLWVKHCCVNSLVCLGDRYSCTAAVGNNALLSLGVRVEGTETFSLFQVHLKMRNQTKSSRSSDGKSSSHFIC